MTATSLPPQLRVHGAILLLAVLGCGGSDSTSPSTGGLEAPPATGGRTTDLLAPTGRIAFVSRRDGNDEIYVMHADGTHLTRLTNNAARDDDPAWSPNGGKIAFASNRAGSSTSALQIYVMNADGTGVTRLTTDAAIDRGPAWSPDGTKIAFTHLAHRIVNRQIVFTSDIDVMKADGSGLIQITTTRHESTPAWSPDGKKIAFTSVRDGNPEIYVMNANGTGATRLTNNAVTDADPAWSPGGAKIAFESDRAGFFTGNAEIYVMNANGSGVTRLTRSPGVDEAPAWSPDGTKLAFDSERTGNFEIFLMNPNGTGVIRLTNNAALDEGPAWKP